MVHPLLFRMEQQLLADPAVGQAKVLNLASSAAEAQSVVVLSLRKSHDGPAPDPSVVKEIRRNLIKSLENDGGKGIVPKRWVLLDDLPVTSAGLVDGEALRLRLNDMQAEAEENALASPMEKKLRQVVADVLRLPLAEVRLSTSFIRLGGDSITAIEVMARCLADGVTINVPEIMTCETLAELASLMVPAADSVGSTQSSIDASDAFTLKPETLAYWNAPEDWYADEVGASSGFEISEQDAHLLLGGLETTLKMTPAEVCLAAIMHSFQSIFTDREVPPVIAIGPDPHAPAQPLTVPVELAFLREDDFKQALRRTKDAVRGAAASLGGTPVASPSFVELVVDYVDERRPGTPPIPVSNGHVDGKAKGNGRMSGRKRSRETKALFEITIRVDMRNHVTLEFDHPRNLQRREDVMNWVDCCQELLQGGLSALASSAPIYSLADFALLSLDTYYDLDDFTGDKLAALEGAAIETAYPCSAVQEGILLARIRFPESYRIERVFEVESHGPARVDLEKLEDAWRTVVSRHAALRTVFVTSSREGAMFDQIVLRSIEPDIARIGPFRNGTAATPVLNALEPAEFEDSLPAHRLTVCKTADGRVFCKLEISHAVVDGMSAGVIFRDLRLAYSGLLPPGPAPLFSDYISYLQRHAKKPALQYWVDHLQGVSPCHFPSIADHVSEPVELKSVSIAIGSMQNLQGFCKAQGVTFATLMQAVWGTVLRAYTQSDDVCFGFLSSGRDAPLANLQSTVGCLIHMLVCRIDFGGFANFSSLLRDLQSTLGRSFVNQHSSLAEIQNALGLDGLPLFNTLMSIDYTAVGETDSESAISFRQMVNYASTEVSCQPRVQIRAILTVSPQYDITLTIDSTAKKLAFQLAYQSSVMSEAQADSLASSFTKVLDFITGSPDAAPSAAEVVGDKDLAQLAAECHVPERKRSCVHWLVEEHIQTRPDAPAIASWDRDLTYAQLGTHASRLALRLQRLGVGPEVLVPICFPKSTWAVVAMVAVLQAGGAFVPLDPSAPRARLQSVLDDTKATLVLAAPSTAEKLQDFAVTVLCVDEDILAALPAPTEPVTSSVQPHNASFVIFTSGSTGKPKGMVMEHSGTATVTEAYPKELSIGPGTRVLQFSAYTFDMGVLDPLTTLARGGTLCIPSDTQRLNDLAGAINALGATWAFLTSVIPISISEVQSN